LLGSSGFQRHQGIYFKHVFQRFDREEIMRTYCNVSGEIASLTLDFSDVQHAAILSGPESQSASFSVAGGSLRVGGEGVASTFDSH
jgi:hypothetical protein